MQMTTRKAIIKSRRPASMGVRGMKSRGKYTFDIRLLDPIRLLLDPVMAVEKYVHTTMAV